MPSSSPNSDPSVGPARGSGDDLAARIRQRGHRMSPSHRKLAEFLLDGRRSSAFLTAAEVAQQAGVSEATVVRFAQSLGYAGYPEMKRSQHADVLRDITTVRRLETTPDSADSASGSILQRSVDADIEALRATAGLVGERDLDTAVRTLTGARTVYVVGHLMSHPPAHLLWFGLRMIGIDARLLEAAAGDAAVTLQGAGPQDALVSVALRRYSAATVDAVETAVDAGVPAVAITDDPLSPTATPAGTVLLVGSATTRFFQSITPAVSVVSALLSACGLHRRDASQHALEQLEERWRRSGVFADG